MSGLIYKKIPALMPEIGAITKSRKNTQQGYSFRGVDDFVNAAHGPFSRAGVFLTSKVISTTREERETRSGGTLIYTILDVEFTLYAEDGSSVSGTMKGEAMDSGDKSCNKAMSAALKYFIRDVFMVPTEEDIDTENHTHEVKPKQRPKAIPNDLGKYVITFGKIHQGKKLEDFEDNDLRILMTEVRKYLDDHKDKPSPAMIEFMDVAERYLEGE